jgi:hypothetical protein
MTQVGVLLTNKTIRLVLTCMLIGRKHPTVGKLVAMNCEEFVIETNGSTGSVIRCHFPRLGFSIRDAANSQTKL